MAQREASLALSLEGLEEGTLAALEEGVQASLEEGVLAALKELDLTTPRRANRSRVLGLGRHGGDIRASPLTDN